MAMDSVTTDDVASIIRDALVGLGMVVSILPDVPAPGGLDLGTDKFLGVIAPDSMGTQFSLSIAYTEGQ